MSHSGSPLAVGVPDCARWAQVRSECLLGSSRGDADLCLPCEATGSYCFTEAQNVSLSCSGYTRSIIHLLVRCSVPCRHVWHFCEPRERRDSSETPTFLLRPPRSLLQNREQHVDLGMEKRNCVYTQSHSASSCATCCNLSSVLFARRTVTPCGCKACQPTGVSF